MLKICIVERDFFRRAVIVELVQYFEMFQTVVHEPTIERVQPTLREAHILLASVEQLTERQAKKIRFEYPHLQIVLLHEQRQSTFSKSIAQHLTYIQLPLTIRQLEKYLHYFNGHAMLNRRHIKPLIQCKVLGEAQLLTEPLCDVKWRTRKSKELFFYLYHFQQTDEVEATAIIRHLWPDRDPEQSKSLLHTTVYQLRTMLKECGIDDPITYRSGRYTLNVDIITEVEEFQRYFDVELRATDVDELIEQYEGDYLQRDAYDWAAPFRQQFRTRLFRQLDQYVARHYALGRLTTRQLRSLVQFVRRVDGKTVEGVPLEEKWREEMQWKEGWPLLKDAFVEIEVE